MNDIVKKGYKAGTFLLSVLTGMVLFTGCTEDIVNQNTCPDDGMMMVDYVVDETLTRSISHSSLPANERIKSLLFLLYNQDGELIKQREIPDIDKMKEDDWPMKRSTMTWKQREALKDTLSKEQKYKAVFIANAQPEFFGGEEVLHTTQTIDGTEVPLPLDKVYLSLPRTQTFGDHNMFYLCVRDIIPTAETDREHPYNCPVNLQRVVCRTDFFSDDYPAWGTDFANGKIREFTDNTVYGQLIPTGASMPFGIESWVQSFTDVFARVATEKGWTAIPPATLLAWIGNLNGVMKKLDYKEYVNHMTANDEKNIRDYLYSSCLRHENLKSLWQPWNGLKAKVAYNGCADRFYVDGRTSFSDTGDPMVLSPLLDTDLMDGESGKECTFTLIGFGENPAATVQNRMKEVRLYNTSDTESPIATLSLPDDKQSFSGQGGNKRIQLQYCPIKTLAYNPEFTGGKTYKLEPVDIKEKVMAEMPTFNLYANYLQKFFETDEGRVYGTSIENFILQITLPDLSQPKALTVEPEWTLK